MTTLLLFLLTLPAFATPEPVRVPEEYRDCSKTEECEAVPLRCGCCQLGAVSKLFVTEYLEMAGKRGCIDVPCHCQPLQLKPACVKKTCQLVSLARAPISRGKKKAARVKPPKSRVPKRKRALKRKRAAAAPEEKTR